MTGKEFIAKKLADAGSAAVNLIEVDKADGHYRLEYVVPEAARPYIDVTARKFQNEVAVDLNQVIVGGSIGVKWQLTAIGAMPDGTGVYMTGKFRFGY